MTQLPYADVEIDSRDLNAWIALITSGKPFAAVAVSMHTENRRLGVVSVVTIRIQEDAPLVSGLSTVATVIEESHRPKLKREPSDDYRCGAEAMREAAAKLADEHRFMVDGDVIAHKIRALPIPEDTP